METSPVQSQSAVGSLTGTASKSMGKDQFLKLLTAQLGNQDPLNPMDDKQFVSQLAQFSSLEQAIETNRQLGMLQTAQSAMVNAQAIDLVGKGVVVVGDTLTLGHDGDKPPISFDLQNDAATMTVSITDENGKVVRTIERNLLKKGAQTLDWDGLDKNGKPLTAGTYRVSFDAKDNAGESVTTQARTTGKVTAVAFDKGYPELLLGDVRIRPADILEIYDIDSQEENSADALLTGV